MTRNELDEILHQCYSVEIFPEEAAELIWGQAFDGETERITGKDEREDCRTTRQRLKLAHDAIRLAVDAFETVNMWEGDNGSTDMHDCLKDFLSTPPQPNTTKSDSSTSVATEDSSATQPLPEPCCPFFEEHPRKMDEEYDEEEHRRL